MGNTLTNTGNLHCGETNTTVFISHNVWPWYEVHRYIQGVSGVVVVNIFGGGSMDYPE